MDCFARVENIPKPILKAVADKAIWQTSADYLAHLEQLPLGPNMVPLLPHSMLRIEVMGLHNSISRDPDDAEIAKMEALLQKAMAEGYAGFSTDALPFHYLANRPMNAAVFRRNMAVLLNCGGSPILCGRIKGSGRRPRPRIAPSRFCARFSLAAGVFMASL